MRNLAHTIRWPAAGCVDDKLVRRSAPPNATKDVKGMRCDGYGSLNRYEHKIESIMEGRKAFDTVRLTNKRQVNIETHRAIIA